MRIIAVIITATLLNCANKGQMASFSPDKEYRKNLSMTINGRAGKGMMTVPKAPTYLLELFPPAKAEVIKITSCHREIIEERKDRPTIWGSNKPIRFNLTPADGIETFGACPWAISTLDLDGNNGWGFVEFENEKLDATLLCNGDAIDAYGVSVCQSKRGLTQRIIFQEKVIFRQTGNCEELDPLKSMPAFDLITPKGMCVYLFTGQDSGNAHRLTIFGYDDIYIEGIKSRNQ